MLRRSLVFLFLVGCATRPQTITLPTVAYPFSRAVLQRDDLTTCADRILDLGWYGQVDWERAAFLRLQNDGKFDCEVWPANRQFRKTEWTGPIPDGTVALIHSHPRTMPNPSSIDAGVAKQLQIPVIVVTPGSIVMVQPRDGTLVTVSHDSVATARHTSVHQSSVQRP